MASVMELGSEYKRFLALSGLKPMSNSKSSSSEHSLSESGVGGSWIGTKWGAGVCGAGVFVNLCLCIFKNNLL